VSVIVPVQNVSEFIYEGQLTCRYMTAYVSVSVPVSVLLSVSVAVAVSVQRTSN